jgi:hypothetical protein
LISNCFQNVENTTKNIVSRTGQFGEKGVAQGLLSRVALQRGDTVVSVNVVFQLCYGGVPTVLKWCYSDATAASLVEKGWHSAC